MANLEPGDIKRIPEIITGNFRVSRRMMMSVDVSYANGGKLHQNCLNDVVVSRDSKSKLPEFCVYCFSASSIALHSASRCSQGS